jgi:transketolase
MSAREWAWFEDRQREPNRSQDVEGWDFSADIEERLLMDKDTDVGYGEVDRLIANTLRMLAVDAVQEANSGHPGLPLGAADVVTVLWTRFLKHNPGDPTWFNRDRFVLSAGHGSALLYALLHVSGYPIPLEELKRFRQWGSYTAGHPEYDPGRGIETTTGPLGQGFANAVGMAIAERWLATRLNQPGFPIIDHFTYVLASDGDLMEGVSHEAASLAGHLGLGRLIVLFDDNGISIDGSTDLSCSDDVVARFEAYGWHTQRVDGHDVAAVDAALRAAQTEIERPSIIACRTHIGYGSPRQDTSKVHGAPLGEEDLRRTKENLGWPLEPRFHVPAAVSERMQQYRGDWAVRQEEWNELLARYRDSYPDLAQQLDLVLSGGLPAGWDAALPAFEAQAIATRAASGKVLDAIAPRLFTMLGGSADLTGSNKTRPQGAEGLRRGDFSGSYLFFGVREHGMGAILNGLALHGLRPYGGTFLTFSDYMRPSIRLAAMMGLPVTYVFSHDSIGLGEDGPTHQPVEHLTALRIIPNLVVLRPADARETAAAWKMALERREGPTALILTRQKLPVVAPMDNGLAQGAYVLAEAETDPPDIVLVATGSEVELALGARARLAATGVVARVVSMPSWELFDAQPESYRNRVLPPGVPRLIIEAGTTRGWSYYVDGKGGVIGLDRFGASGPYKVLFESFGFTTENVVRRAQDLINQ